MARVNKEAVRRSAHLHFPSFLRTRANALLLDAWIKGKQYDAEDHQGNLVGRPYMPTHHTREYTDIAKRSPEPWAGVVVTTLAQTAHVIGIRAPGEQDNLEAWETFERNSWARRQLAIHRDAIGHGASYGVVLRGKDPLTNDRMSMMRGKSQIRMSAFYDEDDDEWCMFAIEATPFQGAEGEDDGWHVRFWDEQAIHYLTCRGEGYELKDWEYISHEVHGFRVPPIARCAYRLDSDGATPSALGPVLPLLGAIDQDKFDRMIVQRFGAWKVRYIAGMAKPSDRATQMYQAMQLKIEDLLVSPDKDTKFGTLEATDLKGFIDAHDADLRVLSAVAQIPPHHLLGLSSNLQAEALAAAETGLRRNSADFRTGAGEFHEQMARLVAVSDGTSEAGLHKSQVRWRDLETVSLGPAADGLFKLATGLKVPVEMLWERIPGWTDSDTERAKDLIESGDSIDAVLAAFAELQGAGADAGAGTPPEQAGGSAA